MVLVNCTCYYLNHLINLNDLVFADIVLDEIFSEHIFRGCLRYKKSIVKNLFILFYFS